MEYKPKAVVCKEKHPDFFPVLGLDVCDKNGVEFHDGDIVSCYWTADGFKYPMKGFVRYFGGRFEVVCPWRNGAAGIEKFVLGLNPTHEIIGHVYTHDHIITEQALRPFAKEGGIKA